MSAYYNEIDPYAAQWLRNLIAAGHIAPGDVDERSIEDVKPDDLRHYTQCHFFAGIGVWSYALRRAGWPDDKPVWTGSCPCQPFSAAGKGNGFADERHLWPAFFHLFKQCKPSVAFGEQVASKDGLRWFDLVQTDLENTGYAAAAVDLCAAGVGAPHIRQRLFWVANSVLSDEKRLGSVSVPLESKQETIRSGAANYWTFDDVIRCSDGRTRPIKSSIQPLANGNTRRVGRLRAYGNAINAEAAKEFIAAFLDVRRGQ
ncbi:DNA cytosine methyltransferase [Pectobacterium versatile]|uniref:DNA cytosine methyltransferase n=1 Tax=Pectobacterium versatile TaxID=2488639 RepID=UPI001F372B90|nr:DNA cytosine methyltransferase [Pectobacterium versatile]